MFEDPALLAEKSIPVFLNIRGNIDIAIWLQVLNRIYARHDALRSRFTVESNETNAGNARNARNEANEANEAHISILSSDEGMPFTFHDLREYGKRKRPTGAVIDKACRTAAFGSFDVAQGPLIRATLIQYEDQRFAFVLAIHHLIADGWSLGILLQEIGTLYSALARGEADPLPTLPIQYQDYAAWAQKRYRSNTTCLDEAYWAKRLSGAPLVNAQALPTSPAAPLSTGLPSSSGSASSPTSSQNSAMSAGKRFKQSYLPVALCADDVAALRQYAKAQNVTLFMVLLSAWAILLGRLTQQTDILIAIPSANRRHPDTVPLIGFFATTLPLRIDLSGMPSAQTLLRRVRDCVLEAQDHQDIPLNRIQAIAESAGRPKGMPLCTHGFNLPTYAATPATQGLHIEKRWIETPSRYSPLPVGLGMEISEYKDAIQGFIAYPSDLERAVVEDYQQQFVSILHACIDQPEHAAYLKTLA
jgi:hypothetical protein